jgi:hypothetical protein
MYSGTCATKEKVFQQKKVRFFLLSSVWSAFHNFLKMSQHYLNPYPTPNYFFGFGSGPHLQILSDSDPQHCWKTSVRRTHNLLGIELFIARSPVFQLCAVGVAFAKKILGPEQKYQWLAFFKGTSAPKRVFGRDERHHLPVLLPELVFTEIIVQILDWISEIAKCSGVFTLDLPSCTGTV